MSIIMTQPPVFDASQEDEHARVLSPEQWLRLNNAALALAHAATRPALLDTLADQLAALFTFDHASLTYPDGSAWQWLPLGGPALARTPDESEAVRQVLDRHEPVIRLLDEGRSAAAFASIVVLPLLDAGRLLGTLQLAQRADNAFTPAEVELASLLAAHVAAALVKHEQIEQLHAEMDTLNERVDALELLNQELDAYDYSAAHDLKAPLSIVNNYAFLLQEALGDGSRDDAVAYAGEIERTVRAMARLLDQLLMVTRAADDDEVLPVTAVRPVLEQVQAQFRQPLAQAGIRLQIEGELPDVRAYPVQLETIFANLVGNAIKYRSETQTPTILIRGMADETQAYFEVRDNGIGMTESEQAKLFRRFSRVGSKEAEGTGLGLAIARRTVERLGGTLGVTSTPGQGSTFAFSLPLAAHE
jgi:signal transduction histidine kinase